MSRSTCCACLPAARAFFARHMNLVNYFTFLVLGLVNNTPYVVVISAAQTLATHFDCEGYVGIVAGCNIAAGVVAQLFNALVLKPLGIAHAYRIMGTSVGFIIGICGLSFSFEIFPEGMHAGFWFSIVFILIIGASTAFGGNVMLGYVAATFPTKTKVKDKEESEKESQKKTSVGMGAKEEERIVLLNDDGGDESRLNDSEDSGVGADSDEPKIEISPESKCQCCRRSSEPKKKREPGEFAIGGWSAGTGLAGILGTFTYLFFNSFNVVFLVRFIVFVPLVFLYLAVFGFAIVEPPKQEESSSDVSEFPDDRQVSLNDDDLDLGEEIDDDLLLRTPEIAEEPSEVKCRGCKEHLCLLLRRATYPALNILLIYWSEYTTSICFGERIFPAKESQKSKYWAVHNAYEIFVTCYGVGVVFSRSSLQLFKVPRCLLWVMTLIQFISMTLWFTMAKWRYMSTPTLVWILFPWMFALGCLGGTCYVNTYYIVVTDPVFSENEETEKARETTINIISILTNIGIALSSATAVLLDNTILKSEELTGSWLRI